MRATDWDTRYTNGQQWTGGPNPLIAELAADLPAGDVVDLAAGEGRHALWFAARGWRTVAVDFAAVGLDRGRSAPYGRQVLWSVADVTTWTTTPASLDLVLVAYLHLPETELVQVLTRAVRWLRPGGRLLVLGHDVDNIARGVGGPQDPDILLSVQRLAPVAALLEVDRYEQVRRGTATGTALDTLLFGRRPVRVPAPR